MNGYISTEIGETKKRPVGRPRGGVSKNLDGSRSKTYLLWVAIKQRCYNRKSHIWKYYGGRGIGMSDDWRYDYLAFARDIGERPEGKWIDRIDNSKGYEKGNCRWVTPEESARNRRQRQKWDHGLRHECREAGLPYMQVYFRIKRLGWPKDKALSTPIRKWNKRGF